MTSRMDRAIGLLMVLMLSAGCRTAEVGGERVFLTVDFEPGRTLRYKFVANRDMLLDWDPNATGEDRIERRFERLEMITAYTPVAVDPYGVNTIRAVCESVTVERSGRHYDADAAEAAGGKTFSFTVDSRGKIVDRSELDALVKEMGDRAFRSGPSGRRIKNPDMIGDFVTGQYFLWDAVSSVDRPGDGVAFGQSWPSKLPVPLPMVLRKARDVVYRLSEIRHGDERLAIIESTYTPAEAAPSDWPVPYSGRFQPSGTFGFLGSYQVLALQGAGRQSFDLEAGRLLTTDQKYTIRMRASLPPMGIRADPHVTIEQTLTTELLAP
ncbi:MAG: hypothetical protein RBR19_11575 [Sedimentisphaerales bacterium]|nr:hypothetical protein [Sedimentisphaerales bacterium]NLT75464.1 hypothetical protein [Planctomycetota bacterium]